MNVAVSEWQSYLNVKISKTVNYYSLQIAHPFLCLQDLVTRPSHPPSLEIVGKKENTMYSSDLDMDHSRLSFGSSNRAFERNKRGMDNFVLEEWDKVVV